MSSGNQDSDAPKLTVPEGFTLHTENTTSILLPSDNGAFLNPVQEFNRDLSVACIRTWSELLNESKEARWRIRIERQSQGKEKRGNKKQKLDTEESVADSEKSVEPVKMEIDVALPANEVTETPKPPIREYDPYKFVLLEALSATGLRAIRYAKEIPLVRHVIANDLSPTAVDAIKRNVELNGLGPSTDEGLQPAEPTSSSQTENSKLGKVRVNEGDACSLMYSHRGERQRVDCVDLDPYGTAAPFIDAAVQCVSDGGLLCVTCTDLAVLGTTNYPEKCWANYGGVPVKAEYCHEVALRLVLHTISTSAARYGRYIQPLLSLSIDFYVRLFIRVQSSAAEVKKLSSQTSTFYVCSGCQSFYEQPMGRVTERTSKKGHVNLLYKQRSGPPVSDKCPECESALHVAGPMWSGPIHDTEFAGRVLEHVESDRKLYGTYARMQGMLTVAKEELQTPFFFTPSKIAGLFHCICPPMDDCASALLNAGFQVSRSHACAGSIKTTATRHDIHDIFRGWIKSHPVKPESIPANSPSARLHATEPKSEANFTHHPNAVTRSASVKLVRYQHNPPHWGPGTKASSKRKRDIEDGADP